MSMRFIFIFCVVLLRPQNIECAGDLSSDGAALLAFREAVDAGNVLGWSQAFNVCTWRGVGCGGEGGPRVIALRLPGSGLVGSFPSGTIAKLSHLQILSLRSNTLSGPFPSDLSDLSSLTKLYLQHNLFSGSLPHAFSPWPQLSQLDLSHNTFHGSIPPSLNNLTHLKSLFLQNNFLSGSLPPLNLPSLSNFTIAFNQLHGSIPNTSTFAKFGTDSFLGNNLCGFPLPDCPLPPSSSPSPLSSTDPPLLPHHKKKKLSTAAIVGIAIGGAVVGIALVLLLYICARRAKKRGQVSRDPTEVQEEVRVEMKRYDEPAISSRTVVKQKKEETNGLVFYGHNQEMFSLEDLLKASAEILGKGSIGTSYKAIIGNGIVVVVKRLRDVIVDRRSFKHQMDLIGNIKHKNLLPLTGYYFSPEEKLLVHEYMPMGSLAALLHGNKGSKQNVLDWQTRIDIILGVGHGLLHLHEEYPYKLCHGNLKSSNVLLSEDLEALISDYGVLEVSKAGVASKSVGHIAPEAREVRKVSAKADVYSYGVLLLEVLTGKAPSSNREESNDAIDLPKWVQSVVKEEWTPKVFDLELLWYQNVEEEMLKLLEVAMACVASSPIERPTMKEVISMIEDARKA